MASIFEILMLLLGVARFFIFAHFIMSWLINFDVLNVRQPLVGQIWYGLQRILEPVYRPIRNFLPDMGGIDLSPIVALLGIEIIRIILINNAGIEGEVKSITEASVEMFDRVMAVNVRGVWLGMKYVIPEMEKRGGGSIVLTSSIMGVAGAPRNAAYAASKHAVVGLTRSAADEVARYGIRVNALCPSFAPTPLMEEMADALADQHGVGREDAYTRVTGRIPMRRLATVQEVVQAMLWAADPANSFMTGQAIAIDGGLTAV